MAKKPTGVWGIDIGHCALKALRCRLEGGQIVADGFDYIEYPKMLNQPESEPAQLVQEALEQFLSRNEITGDKLALAVPGQTGLTKFFKPPPVNPKRVAEIVKYEARQQIPFSLDEVVWDFQLMAGGMEVEGLLLESEIGLFAMKRDQVYRAMRPFDAADVELDVIQLAPLCVYNYVSYDVLADGPSDDEFDPDDPPESLVVLDMGTDTTDLVITNGFRVWQRSVPVGGNHFTKQLTRQLKLTFAKAEHLKRHARDAKDPKALFQAMRPVFNDLVTEVQRSIGYFQGIDRKAKIGGVLLMGNGMKLPGLQQYLAKNLGYKIIDFKNFTRLSGPSVLTSPAFKENHLAFGVCYGLCLQTVGQARLRTNLVPREILNDRMIRSKKPWALASVAALLLACCLNFWFQAGAWYRVQPERAVQGVKWDQAVSSSGNVQSQAATFKSTDTAKIQQLDHLKAIGEEVSGNAERRLLWMEFLKALNQAVPRDPDFRPDEIPDIRAKPFTERRDVFIESVETQYLPDLAAWYTPLAQQKYLEALEARGERTEDMIDAAATGIAAPAAPPPAPNFAPPAAADAVPAVTLPEDTDLLPVNAAGVSGPSGPGWVVQLNGHHFFNATLQDGGPRYVRRVILPSLEDSLVELPGELGQPEQFSMREMGVGYAILSAGSLDAGYRVPNPYFTGIEAPATPAPGALPRAPLSPLTLAGPPAAVPPAPVIDPDNPPYFAAPRYTFTIQFVWKPRPLSQRLEARRLLQQQQLEPAESPQPPAEQPADSPDAGQVRTQPAQDDTAPIQPQDA